MARSSPFYLLKETRVSTESAHPGTTVVIRLPSNGTSLPSLRAAPKRPHLSDVPVAQDEGSYSKLYLASSASIHFRRRKSPRSILWRVLEDGKTLSLQSLDLERTKTGGRRGGNDSRPALTLRLSFPHSIRPASVVFADSEGQPTFNIFVLTTANVLYTLTVRDLFFQRPTSSEGNVGEWCKLFSPSAFTFRYPHRLIALDSNHLLISLHDGGLLRLKKRPVDDGSSWDESFLNDGGWKSSIRGLLPWQGHNTVRYGNISLSNNTATSIVLSPDQSRVFAVSLDHTIKAWNLQNGHVDFSKDLLDVERKPEAAARYQIEPSRHSLIWVLPDSSRIGDLYHLVTYSPAGAGQFKFWSVRNGLENSIDIVDMFPDDVLEPPPPSSEIWTMAEFKILNTASMSTKVISILWKNNTSSRIQTLEIDVLSAPEKWNSHWVAVALEILQGTPLPVPSDVDPSGISEKWVDYFLYPERFAVSTLETAVFIYEQSINPESNRSKLGSKALSERMCSAVASQVVLQRAESGVVDYERFNHDTDLQWRRLYRIAADLEKRRFEALSLAVDEEAGLQWLVTCGGASAVRNCSDIEILQHNHRDNTKSKEFRSLCKSRHLLHKIEGSAQKLEGILSASASFRESFSDTLSHAFDVVADCEIFSDPSFSISERMKIFYDQCNFAGHVGDDEYNALISALDNLGGIGVLTTHLFGEIMQRLLNCPPRADDGIGSEIGVKLMTRLAQETINMNIDILKGLLALVVFLEVEMDKEDDNIKNLDAADTFVELLSMLKGHIVLYWMSQHTVLQKISTTSQVQEGAEGNPKDIQGDSIHVSLLQQLVTEVATVPSIENQHEHFASRLELDVHLMLWNTGLMEDDKYDQRVISIQSNLLRNGEIELAEEFSKFLPNTEAACYLKGRLDMCLADNVSASALFKKAAYGLSVTRPRQVSMEAFDHLIPLDEITSFHSGQAKYFKHVADLFGRERVYSYAADFAALALQYLGHSDEEEALSLRTELLSELFYASLKSSRFDNCYTALTKFTNKTLQRDAIRRLTGAMIDHSQTAHLLNLPFLGLQGEVDTAIALKCQTAPFIRAGPSYHKVLYSWRVRHGDYRGAASVLYEWLNRLKSINAEGVTEAYLVLINTLASVEKSQAWLLSDGVKPKGEMEKSKLQGNVSKRRVVTLEDVRKEYQAELDRLALIENGRFAFGEGDQMDGIEAL